MSHKEVGELNSEISSVDNQYSCLVQLLGVLKIMLAKKRLLKKRLLLLMSSESTMKNGKKESRCSPPHFWVRPHRNLKWWNNFMNGNMIQEEWKDNFRIHFTFCVKSYNHTFRKKPQDFANQYL